MTPLTVLPSPSKTRELIFFHPETAHHRGPYAPVEATVLDRHLRPDEIDLLLDTEVGFGVQPLRAHVLECPQCQGELDRAQELLFVIEDLPHFTPSADFAERVMLQVQVFEPWHVAARNSVLRLVPSSQPARVAAGVGLAASTGIMVTGATWALNNADIGLLMANVGLEQARTSAAAAAADLVIVAVGQTGLEAWIAGGPMVAVAAGAGFVMAAGAMVAGLRALTTQRSRG